MRRLALDVPGGQIAGMAFGVATPSPDILFLHATGFNAGAYRQMLAPLGERFHVWAIDFRGHGRTSLPARTFGYSSWRRHRDDVIALLETHASAPVTLAGHSLGGTVALLAAAKRPDLVASLALIDPVIGPVGFYAAMELPFATTVMRRAFPLARSAGRRRASFASREIAARAFAGRGVFKAFSPQMIADYLEDGLVEDGKGEFRLSCSPAYERATFAAHRNNPWAAFRHVACPIVALRADKQSTFAAVAAHRLAAIKPKARIATVDGAGHMLPMERPDRVRAAIESAALMGRRGGLDIA